MKRVSYPLATALVVMTAALCKGQSDLINKMMPKPVPASPNAAALGKFGDYQVSHFTGLPNISIPIFEAKSGELSVPITLDYHASGNRLTDVASWVGLGWSLSTAGQITRSVNGKKDEDSYFTQPLNPTPSSCASYWYLNYATSNALDTEPDVFSYSYPGGNGKFIFVNQGAYNNLNPLATSPIGPAYLFPYAPIVVNRVNDQKYEITDERGILYRFGTSAAGVNYTEQTNAFNGGNPSVQATTSWPLADIIAPNSNDVITLKYQSIGTASRHDVAHTWLVTDLCDSNGALGSDCPTPTHGTSQPTLNTDSNVNQQAVSEIQFETGKVLFVKSTGQRSDMTTALNYLDRIEIQELFDGAYTTKKTIQFSYSYFTNAAGGNAALKLDAIQFKDSGGAIVQTYSFNYFTNSFSWNPTNPNYLNARDYWGFYNGATGNTDLVKQQTVLYQQTVASTPTNITVGGAANRDVNTAYSKEGVLKRINFPTGGYTEFDFENHKYLNDQSVATYSGGLRVTKITSTESASGVPMIKTYKYGTGESGIGRALFSTNQLNYVAEQIIAGGICDGINPAPVVYRIRTYQSSSFNVEESSPVVYPAVTEYIGDPAGTTNGKTVYEFDAGFIPGDVDQTVNPSTKVFRNTYAWKRGKLTKTTVYDRLNNKLSELETTYTTFKDVGVLVGVGAYVYRTGPAVACGGGVCVNEQGQTVSNDLYHASTYTQSSGVQMPTLTVERTFENGAITNVVTVTTTSQFFQDELQLQQKTVTRSNSAEETITLYRYPFNVPSNSGAIATARGLYLLKAKHVLSVPHETYTYLQNTGGTNKRIISGQLTNFRDNWGNPNYAVPVQIFLLELSEPLPLASYTPSVLNVAQTDVVIDSRYKERIVFNKMYDANSKLLQFSQTKDVPTSFLYGYNNKLPVVEIKNAQNDPGTLVEFKLEGFEDVTGTNIVDNAANAHSGRKYYNGDYTISFTKPNTRNYIIEYYYFSSPNWIYISKPYTGPTMALTEGTRIDNIRIRPADALMSSYTYHPLYGISSATDSNGVTTFYEYDSFGRLQLVKDYANNAMSTYKYHFYKQQ